jgi:hypothetical protein
MRSFQPSFFLSNLHSHAPRGMGTCALYMKCGNELVWPSAWWMVYMLVLAHTLGTVNSLLRQFCIGTQTPVTITQYVLNKVNYE